MCSVSEVTHVIKNRLRKHIPGTQPYVEEKQWVVVTKNTLKEHTIKTPEQHSLLVCFPSHPQPRRLDMSGGILSIKRLPVPLNGNNLWSSHVWVCRHVKNISESRFGSFVLGLLGARCVGCSVSLHLLQGNGSDRLNRMDVTGVKLSSPSRFFPVHQIVGIV